MKRILIIALLPLMFILPTTAAAEEISTPPTEQCVDLFTQEMQILGLDATKKQQQKFAETLYSAGCLTSNRTSYNKITPFSQKCLALSKAMNAYLLGVSREPGLAQLLKANRLYERRISSLSKDQLKLELKIKSISKRTPGGKTLVKKLTKKWVRLEQNKNSYKSRIYSNDKKIDNIVTPHSFSIVLAYLNASSAKCVPDTIDFAHSKAPFDRAVQKHKGLYWAALWSVLKQI